MKVHLGVYRENGWLLKVKNALVRHVYCDTQYTICSLVFLSERILYVRCVVSYDYSRRQFDKNTYISDSKNNNVDHTSWAISRSMAFESSDIGMAGS
jgi:hypothetical protein